MLGVGSRGRCGDEGLVRARRGLQRACEQAVEAQADAARGSAVEAEHELVEVGVELFVIDAALVGSEQPALEQRGDAVAGGQLAVRGLAVARLVEADLLVPVAGGGEAVVAVPAVGLKDRLAEPVVFVGEAGGDVPLYEPGQRVGADVRDPFESCAAKAHRLVLFDRDRDDRLVRLTAPLRASAGPADVALVELDHAVEQAARRAHRAPQLVQHRPRRLIRAEPEPTLQIERADTALLAGYEPDGAQPHPERHPAIGKQRARTERHLGPARRAAPPLRPRRDQPTTPPAAPRAHKPLRPAQPLKVSRAARLVHKPALELTPLTRVLDPGPRATHNGRKPHTPTLLTASGCVKGIAHCRETEFSAPHTLVETRARDWTPALHISCQI